MTTFNIEFSATAWHEYTEWQTEDRRTLKKINQLIAATVRDPFEGVGKPEPLKHSLAGAWSRRIDSTNRLVYRVLPDRLQIIQVKYHY